MWRCVVVIRSIPQVLQEINAGHGLDLAAVGRQFPGAHGCPAVNATTVRRWATKGSKTPDGRLVTLETIRLGARVLTSGPAVVRFVMALSEPSEIDCPTTERVQNR
jgi:hypothetical protein